MKGNGLQLYNMITDAAGTQALLLGRDNVLSCDVGGPVRPYLAQGGTAATTSLDWLYGPIVVDQSGASPGEGADGKYGPRPAFWEAAGRVSADVARVTLTVAHKTTGATETVEAKVLNGTFQARLVLPTGSPLITGSDETGEEQRSVATSVVPTLRAYDADGRLVGQIVQSGKDHVPAGCYATPSGQVIYGVREGQAACKPATSWRP
ncbi:MAG TPA: hypothetical protein VGR21_02270 [Cryptosporangiaceae bacterium]|nr:hypothetical protein [Cryptosporangiaceae bacterium]